MSKEQLIEWGILLFLYFVGPAIGRFVKRKQAEQAARQGQGGPSDLASDETESPAPAPVRQEP
ncbi:MAG: hypothetical protein R3F39_24590, partial [Myxococcota bacterium]